MTEFQFDENFDARKHVRACKDAGHSVHRFPRADKGNQDPDVLAKFMAMDRVLVTLDRCILSDHLDSVPDENPGVIVVEHSPAVLKTMTCDDGAAILNRFKSGFAHWTTTTWKNSLVVITEKTVAVWEKSDDGLNLKADLDLSSPVWGQELLSYLEAESEPNLDKNGE